MQRDLIKNNKKEKALKKVMWTPVNLEIYNAEQIHEKAIYILNRRCSRAPARYFDFYSLRKNNSLRERIKRRLNRWPNDLPVYLKSNSLKIARLIVATASVTYCLYQILMILMMYSQYKTKVSVYVSEPETLHMPGITVCTNTRILKSKYEMHKNNFNEEIMRKYSLKTVDPKELLQKASISDIEKMSPDRNVFISSFYCNDHSLNTGDEALNQKRSKNCVTYPVIKSLQPGGRCFTYFNHVLEKPKIRDKTEDEIEFEDNDLLIMKVNFTPNDRIGVLQTGGRVIIHDNLDIPSTLTKSVPIVPGGFYEIFIKRESIYNMEYPYDTSCKDYDQNLGHIKKTGNFFIPLNRIQCIETCIANTTIDGCNCWPNDIPFVSNFTDPKTNKLLWNGLDQNGSLAWCNVSEIIRAGNYSKCFQRKLCADSCPKSCRKDNYEFFSYSSKYVENEVFPLNKSELNDMAFITIRYSTTEYTSSQREPLLQLVEAVCLIGGLMGMYIGISFITIYDLIVMCLIKFCETAKKAHKKIIE